MDPRPSDRIECRPGRDHPIAWRSSFVRADSPVLPEQAVWGTVDAGLLLARHVVPSRTIAVVRRITAQPFVRTGREGGFDYSVDPQPDWWHVPGTVGAAWDWAWNIGKSGLNQPNTTAHPGFVLQAPLGLIRDILQARVRFDFADDWQRLSDSPTFAMHGCGTRYIVEGPQIITLWAIVTLTGWHPDPEEPPPKVPTLYIGGSFGSLEGIDIPIDRYMDDPAQWLIP